MSAIILSWFLSPILAGITAYFLYLITYYSILHNKTTSYHNTKYAFPIIVGITIAINVSLFMIKDAGENKNILSNITIIHRNGVILVIILISFLFGFIITLLLLPRILSKKISKLEYNMYLLL